MHKESANRWDKQRYTSIPDKLQDYMKKLQFFDDDIDDYLYIYDLTAERVYFTNKICRRFPLQLEDDNGIKFSDWENIVYPKDRKFMDCYRRQLIDGEIESFNIMYRIIDIQENKVWMNVKGAIRKGEDGCSKLLVGRISEARLGRLIDGLTGLCSIEKFMEDLKEYQKTSDGYLIIFGADNFKNINITQGRAAGDNILKQIAATLDENSEYPVSVYRLDGDCFAMVFPNKQRQEIIDFYDLIQKKLEKICTLSAGVVLYKSGYAADSGVIYQYAENALDQAKKEGKNKLVFFSQNSYQKDLKQLELLDEMKAAVEQGCKGFCLHYQPQLNSRTFAVDGVEVLLRYNSPSRGYMSPMEFIPLLESSELICPVGEWVLKTALLQCKEWRKSLPNLRISVNLSQVQLQQKGIAEMVLNLVKEAELPGAALVLEVTESIQLQDYIAVNRIFYAWKQYGIKISIDDFGTGYSSLSYLKSIEIDEVKIDKCFVNHVQCNAYNYRLLKNMIELAHSAKIDVCCEGVETFEEFLALQELHTDLYQGYLFAKPCTKENFEQVFISTEASAYQDRKLKQSYFQHVKSNGHKELLENFRKEEIGSITENMEEVVYVSDVDTHELYYLNAAGRQITGVYDYKGCKCYQVLRGLNSPCENCTNKQLCENKFFVWENENTYLEKKYILKDKLIRWQGKIVRLEIAIDITEREVVSKSIQKKLDFEQAIIDACRILASETDPEKINYNVVRSIGEFCQGTRAYILKVGYNDNYYELNSEWYVEGEESIKQYFPMTVEGFQEENSEHRIAVRIFRENKIIGLVGVDNPYYKEEGYDLVKTMAYFLGYSMTGEKNQQKLNHLLESRYGDIRNHTDLGLWEIRINPQNGECELYPDKVMCRIMEMEENLPPQESYNYWYSRIQADCNDYVNQKVQKMIQTGNIIHLEYSWNLPSKGAVIVQCVGARREDCDDRICLEGYHWVISN